MVNQFSEIIWHHHQLSAAQVAQEYKESVKGKGPASLEARVWERIAQPLPKQGFSRINIAYVEPRNQGLFNRDGSPAGLDSFIMDIYRDTYCKAYRWTSMYISLGEMGLADIAKAVQFDQHFMRILRGLVEIYRRQLLTLNLRTESLESTWRLSSPCRYLSEHKYHPAGPEEGMTCLLQ